MNKTTNYNLNTFENSDKIQEALTVKLEENFEIIDTQLKSLNDNKAPKSHASTATTYGVGTTSNYGHCKTINNLTTSAHTNGYALSAYQGYLLNQNKENNSNKVISISASSTDEEYPSAKAVYTAIQAGGGGGGSANIIYSTTDLEAGVSELAEGTVYLVYE